MRSWRINLRLNRSVSACLVLFLAALFTAAASATTIPITTGCIGSCGTDTTGNGNVLPATGFSSYNFVTTTGGATGGGTIPVGATGTETDGSTLTTSVFAATSGSVLQFFFNYITSDGSGFPDYAWAELETSTGAPVALLFTARTEPSGTIAPGSGLPTPVATLTPPSVPITPGSGTACSTTCNSPAGGPVWSEIGSYSGDCWASGCGLTGWIQSDYTIPVAGNYELAFGVTNTVDTLYDSGLAIDGTTIAGAPIPIGSSPEPSTLALFCLGTSALVIARRRKLRR
jgi:hypothetical protein